MCPACEAKRRHDPQEWAMYHPNAGRGFDGNQWSLLPEEPAGSPGEPPRSPDADPA